MKHYIIAKLVDGCDKKELLEPVEALFRETLNIPGIHGVRVKPCVVNRPNRYDIMIEIDMDPEALEEYDKSEPHHRWKDQYGHLIQKKTIFDSED
ncbi:MAG: Dabb family protein [Lachnospiraceae bacterium]|nr:Dabb family protein [Lachnospiraceae bacterium]